MILFSLKKRLRQIIITKERDLWNIQAVSSLSGIVNLNPELGLQFYAWNDESGIIYNTMNNTPQKLPASTTPEQTEVSVS